MRQSACILIGILSATSAALSAPPADPADAPELRWHGWTQPGEPIIVGVFDDSLWFYQPRRLSRYDVASGRLESFGPLSAMYVSPWTMLQRRADGAVAVSRPSVSGQGLLWQPGGGWRSLPARSLEAAFSFTPDGGLRAFYASRPHRLVDGAFKPLLDRSAAASIRAAMPADGGYLCFGVTAYQPKKWTAPLAWASADLTTLRPFELPDGLKAPGRSLRHEGKLLVLLTGRDEGIGRDAGGLFEVTPDRLIERVRGRFCGPDLKGGGFVRATVSEVVGQSVLTIHSSRGGPPERIPAPPRLPDEFHLLIRDRTGALWLGAHRRDGQRWEWIRPRFTFPDVPPATALDESKLRLDEGLSWRRVRPHVPLEVTGYDAAGGTGWLRVRVQHDGRQIEQLRWGLFAPDGTQRPGRTVPADSFTGSPQFRTAAGDWWWLGERNGQPRAIRLTPDGKVHGYSTGHEGGNPNSVQYTHPGLFLSPEGNVWIWRNERYFARYRPGHDDFERAEPWDEFAFRCGPATLSAVCEHRRHSRWNYLRQVNVVYRKQDGRWAPLAHPFGGGNLMRGFVGFAHGRRLLLNHACLGILEHDVATGEWALLHGASNMTARFDSAGRKLMVSTFSDGPVYHLAGDPIAYRRRGRAAALERVRGLIKELADPRYGVRAEASRQLEALLCPAYHAAVSAELQREDLSDEQRLRLASALESALADYPQRRSLYDEMLTRPKPLE